MRPPTRRTRCDSSKNNLKLGLVAISSAEVIVEPEAGIGPATYALRVRCSTTELPGRDAHSTE